jgi:hypothetical protein
MPQHNTARSPSQCVTCSVTLRPERPTSQPPVLDSTRWNAGACPASNPHLGGVWVWLQDQSARC